MYIPDALVSAQWLHLHLEAPNLVVLDATLPKVTAKGEEPKNHRKECIPRARFFDIKNVFSDPKGIFPNTLLSPSSFALEAQRLGIHKNSCIVVYDDHGIYSSPRAWWCFRAMGFENVAVLDGGLPSWIENDLPTSDEYEEVSSLGTFESNYHEGTFSDKNDILDTLNNDTIVLDARSSLRYEGVAPEPRAGVRSGHIPKSKSLPYAELLNGSVFKSSEEINNIYRDKNPNSKRMIFSCGTGITACVLALGAHVSGYTNISVYDGSWTEWGSLKELPIEK